jgi:hypothetical protein
VSRDFRLHVFFHESVSPKLLSIPFWHFYFWKFTEIFAAQVAPLVSLKLMANGKKTSIGSFRCFDRTQLGSGVNIKVIFFFEFTLRYKQSDIIPIFLPLISTTMVVNLPSVPKVKLIPVTNLPLMLLTLVVLLDLRISPRIFEKIWNDPNVISGAWGKMIQEKNLKQKISWHWPFNIPSIGGESVEFRLK